MTFLTDQLSMGQLFEMEGQCIGSDAQQLGQDTGCQPFGACDHEGAKNAQAGFMGQGGERADDLGFLHLTIIHQMLNS
ncbi:MAG: hypothetical protein BGO79_03980 [Delftia sp. 67-8]|nr:MAG: hypothetical protein BGO79_03980 [Delftia sp. 67-8]